MRRPVQIVPLSRVGPAHNIVLVPNRELGEEDGFLYGRGKDIEKIVNGPGPGREAGLQSSRTRR